MASHAIFNSISPLISSSITANFNPPPNKLTAPSIQFSNSSGRKSRGRSVITHAGPPSTSNLVFAFVVPLGLLGITVLASILVDDKLERDYLEELAINKAIREDDGEDEGDSGMGLVEETKERNRSRNRPKREVEVEV